MIHVYGELEIDELHKTACDELVQLIREKPTAVILLPTGSTPIPFYKTLKEYFINNTDFDMSKATYFNLDEYVGLPNEHPLSYAYYMQHYVYGPLREIDPLRAPKNTHIFTSLDTDATPEVTVARLKAVLDAAGPIDLALLGIGGAYIAEEEGKQVLHGGHIAFNEPGTERTCPCHVVQLTDKTRLDTRHRFSSLRQLIHSGVIKGQFNTEVPTAAMSIGLKEILSADKIILLATGEDKGPAIDMVFNDGPSTIDCPASFLKEHSNVSWYLDAFAGKKFYETRWQHGDKVTDEKQWLNTCAYRLAIEKGNINNIHIDDFTSAHIPKSITDHLSLENIWNTLKNDLTANVNNLPSNKIILILSPHPDDDVISMGGTVQELVKRNNIIHVLYAVSGANAVRATCDLYDKAYNIIKEQNNNDTDVQPEQVKTLVREMEATSAINLLGVSKDNLVFFNGEYYSRRGIPGIESLTEPDMIHMKDILLKINPDYIYFAAEADPHGAHGLASQLMARNIHHLPNTVQVMGYRGAWNEWVLSHETDKLTFVTMDEKNIQNKIESIKLHQSQLHPLFPGFDTREFWERAEARNRHVAKEYKKVLVSLCCDVETLKDMKGLEVFRQYSRDEFIDSYA